MSAVFIDRLEPVPLVLITRPRRDGTPNTGMPPPGRAFL